MITPAVRERIQVAKTAFETLRPKKDDLLRLLDESEVPESVYNSNAIENSTLTLEETERVLLAVEVSRDMDLREIHEAQNLARVGDYVRSRPNEEISPDLMLLLHRMLLGNIEESIAGRFRGGGEFVRVGTHMAPGPELVESLLQQMCVAFASSIGLHVVERIARLHLEFERIHPFVDGNGRIGRVLVNVALRRNGFPPVIIRNKGKLSYYAAIRRYDAGRSTREFEAQLALAVLESLNRRIAYLRNAEIVSVPDLARASGNRSNVLLNQARRQTLPAFRERGVWKVSADALASNP